MRLLSLLVLVTPPLLGQSVADRIARAEGTVRLTIAARPQVCGNGNFIGEDTPTAFRSYTIHPNGFSINVSADFRPTCHEGPIRLAFDRTEGAIAHLRAAVGVPWRPDPAATDVSNVPAAQAVEWLLAQVPRLGSDDDVRVALLVASLADSARVAESMLRLIEDRSLRMGTRREAMRWVRGAAEREGHVEAADRVLREVVADAAAHTELREFALRRLGESRSDANAAFLERVALDRTATPAMRDRAVRVLGEEFNQPDRVRALYSQLEHRTVRERALRTYAEQAGPAAHDWLQAIALDGQETPGLRERAVRELAERGMATADLVRLYDRANDRAVRSRLIRIFAERGDGAGLAKLTAIMENDPDTGLRREAQRRLAERVGRGV
jgi:hypothetical protein